MGLYDWGYLVDKKSHAQYWGFKFVQGKAYMNTLCSLPCQSLLIPQKHGSDKPIPILKPSESKKTLGENVKTN